MYKNVLKYEIYEEVQDRWKVSESVRFSQWSQQPAVNQKSVFLVQRASGSLHWQFDPVED